MIDYSPLWQTMRKKNCSQYKLLQSGIDNKTLDSLKKNKNITLLTVEKLCQILDCTPNDIVAFTKNSWEIETLCISSSSIKKLKKSAQQQAETKKEC